MLMSLGTADIGVGAGTILAVAACLTLFAKWVRALYRKAEARAETQATLAWLREQMKANGAAKDAGTQEQSIRDVTDGQTVSLDALLKMASTSGAAIERLDRNQGRMGRRLAYLTHRVDGHLIDGHGGRRGVELPDEDKEYPI